MPKPVSRRLSRRRALQGAAAGFSGAAAGFSARPAAAWQAATPEPDWARFDDDIQTAMETFGIVGAAVAVVDRDSLVHSGAYGLRDQESSQPVTPDTHFLVASTTKSMTSLLLATFVDDGVFAWDQPVREVWPDFRAPSDGLTNTLRVRDMLGMASGLGEDVAVSAYHQGDLTAGQLLRSLAALPVTDPPETTFFYNGTVYAAGGYLPALAQGAAENGLETAFATLMAERVYGPAGMATARISDDPRPFVANYATGYGPDLTDGTAAQPYAAVGCYAPAGGTLATLEDMANYVAMHLNEGVSLAGERVVSAENLAERWAPHIALPPVPPELQPDFVSASYGMGLVVYEYRGGVRFVGHSGGIDGFTTFIGFFPDDGLGLVVLSNASPFPAGLSFAPLFVPNLLMESQFGLNAGGNDAVISQFRASEQQWTGLAAQAEPVDAEAIAPYLGDYEVGWRVAFDPDGELRMRQSSRAIRLLAMPDGGYVMAGGVTPGVMVRFSRDETGMPWMEIQDLERVRWVVGLETTAVPDASPTP